MPITPAEFERRMAEIAARRVKESRHDEAIGLMCEVLRQFGYDAGIGVFERERWFS